MANFCITHTIIKAIHSYIDISLGQTSGRYIQTWYKAGSKASAKLLPM